MSEIKNIPFNETWDSGIRFWWHIYNSSSSSTTGKSNETLSDRQDLLFNMTCYSQVVKSVRKGATFEMDMNLEPPFLTPKGSTTWSSLTNEGHVVCPEGQCMAPSGCEGLTMPKWDKDDIKQPPQGSEDSQP
ncbi:uncharacterized protein IL334_002186 [Kwoniella shivajii]|uniref:Uncharacterized protein n=1 Tax=Kwoniella shivajii TaxID=564305 RepID=A0ABZ1CU00_9TREE|nr:hypothetical protein IL334_002186 [Kwoniella shivajii]